MNITDSNISFVREDLLFQFKIISKYACPVKIERSRVSYKLMLFFSFSSPVLLFFLFIAWNSERTDFFSKNFWINFHSIFKESLFVCFSGVPNKEQLNKFN